MAGLKWSVRRSLRGRLRVSQSGAEGGEEAEVADVDEIDNNILPQQH